MAQFRSISFLKGLYRVTFVLSVIGLLLLVVDFGFPQSGPIQLAFETSYYIILVLGIFTTLLRYIGNRKKKMWSVLVVDLLTVSYTLLLLYANLISDQSSSIFTLLQKDGWIQFAIFISFVREFAEQKINYRRTLLNPAQLFIASFLAIILIGTGLLLLPNATFGSISFIDALFTSTSAVCVTGLIVVDTGTYFTLFGQSIILLLIQVGGIGILTFASYFSYFFKGGSSYEQQLLLTEIMNTQKVGEVFSLVKKVLFITFSIEAVGALLLYFTTSRESFSSLFDHVYFSFFHSVSAFCNAGFSTLSDGLNTSGLYNNYNFQLVIILLVVLGGLGFPIVVNLLKYLRYLIVNRLLRFSSSRSQFKPWVLNINSRIALITTVSLLGVGTLFFFISEYNHALQAHQGMGKFVTALFGAVTPRTAGFNTIDMASMQYATIMLTVFLMWIGASPASTGGGIKTNTFAVAMLNILSLAKGKSRIEVYRREIAPVSIRRAFAVMVLSLFVIGLGVIGISISNPELHIRDVVFECFSAYSTVGLSLGITDELNLSGKFLIAIIMFVGRVSMLSILIAIFKEVRTGAYRYPTEEILIN